MSNYSKTTDFEAKDSLPTGDSGKIIRGAEFETEFDAISTAIATKADTAGPTFTGTLTFETISDGSIGVTAFVDEDNMASNSATLVPTQQSVKAYVDSQVTAQDLDFQADSGGALSIDLDSETLTFTGGTGVDTSGSGNAVTFAIDSTVATLTGTQTLTNKTLTSPDVNTPDIDGGTIDGTVIGGATPAAVSATTVSATGNITVGGTVDGRDVATDGSKLDGIEAGATADQTAAEIRAAVEAATDSNVFTDADHTKLDGIEASATADQTDAEIRAAVEAATDSNVFTDADHSKLDGIEANATADQTDAEIRAAVEAATDSNVFTDADHTKLDGIEALADVTDTTNVTAAGALMDSELTNITAVKSLNQGVATTDTPTFAGLATSANVTFGDNDKAIFGASSDLQIYHDGSNSHIKDTATGNLNISGNDIQILNAASNEAMAYFAQDGSVTLYHNGSEKLATASTGVDVTGVITTDGMTTSGNVDFGDLDMARFGVGNDLQIFHNGTENYIKSATSDQDLRIQGNDGGNTIDALVFDMSAAGAATFNAGASFGGTVTADDLDVQQAGFTSVLVGSTNASGSMLILDGDSNGDGSGGDYSYVYHNTDGQLELLQNSPSGTDEMLFKTAGNNLRMKIGSGGDISFYEDTGTTAKLFWDASAESLGLGTTSPSAKLDIQQGTAGNIVSAEFDNTDYTANNRNAIKIRQQTSSSSSYSTFLGTDKNTGNVFLSNDSITADHFVINPSGNVGIGTSSPSYPLTVDGYIGVRGGNGITFLNPSNNYTSDIYNGASSGTSDLRFKTQATERMRIDSSGNVEVKGGQELRVYRGDNATYGSMKYLTGSGGLQLNDKNGDGISFVQADGATEYARFDSSGNLMVGTTSTANIANATPNVVTDQSYGINDTANKVAFQVDRISFDSSNYYVLNASAIGVKLVNGATAWTTQSDETLKENITELTNVLSKVQNLRCVSYNLKSQNSDDVKLGFIAQDWQTDFSQVVNVDPCDGKLGMNYTETIPVLLKAIQEQTEIINDLRARVAQLEGEN